MAEIFVAAIVVGIVSFFWGVCIGNEADARSIKKGFFEHNGKVYRVIPAEVK